MNKGCIAVPKMGLGEGVKMGPVVAWSHVEADHFAVAGEDVRTYRLCTPTDAEPGDAGKYIKQTGMQALMNRSTCLAWSWGQISKSMMAVGLQDGSVMLINPLDDSWLPIEFAAKSKRATIVTQWNQQHADRVAVGLAAYRNDYGVCIWDVSRAPAREKTTQAVRLGSRLVDTQRALATPLYQLMMAEGAAGLSWVPQQPHCLVVGTSSKVLHFFDLRKSTDLKAPRTVSVHPKAVMGVSFDPFMDTRLSTFGEDGTVKLWDSRQMGGALFTLSTGKGLRDMQWSPQRKGVFFTHHKDNRMLNLWDIKEGKEISLNQGCEKVMLAPNVTGLAWPKGSDSQVMTVTKDGGIHLTSLIRKPPIACNVWGDVALASRRTVQLHESKEGSGVDIALLMRRRVVRYNYGLDPSINLEALLGEDPTGVLSLWRWVKRCEAIKLPPGISVAHRYEGILNLMQSQSKVESSVIPGGKGRLSVYTSPQRSKAMLMCGWHTSCSSMVSQLVRLGEVSRAAAMAIFHFDLPLAVHTLMEGGNQAQQTMAMVMSGFERPTKLWRETCASVVAGMNDPYLSVVPAFLQAEDAEGLSSVFTSDIQLEDKIALACRFVPDQHLQGALEKMQLSAQRTGEVTGLLLTGLGEEGVETMQVFVDATGDIQTAALLFARVVPSVFEQEVVWKWIQLYRDLLDMWRLWHVRAKMDIDHKANPSPPIQVYARCGLCSKSLSAAMVDSRGNARNRGQINHLSYCPHCRNALSHCALCLQPVRCQWTSNGVLAKGKADEIHVFDDWLTWCQKCFHGGHAGHYETWFAQHSVCPVNGCDCRCDS